MQALPIPKYAAPAFANPTCDRVLHVVGTFAAATDRARLGTPDGIVMVRRADDGVGDFVQDGVGDLGKLRPQTIAHGEVDAPFPVTAHAGTHRRQIEAQSPPGVQAAERLVHVEKLGSQRFDLRKGVLATRTLDHFEGPVTDAQPSLSLVDDDRMALLQLSHGAADSPPGADKANPTAHRTGRPREVGSHGPRANGHGRCYFETGVPVST